MSFYFLYNFRCLSSFYLSLGGECRNFSSRSKPVLSCVFRLSPFIKCLQDSIMSLIELPCLNYGSINTIKLISSIVKCLNDPSPNLIITFTEINKIYKTIVYKMKFETTINKLKLHHFVVF